MSMTINGQTGYFLANLCLCSEFPSMVDLTPAGSLARNIKNGSNVLGRLNVSSFGEEDRDASD